MGKDKKKSLITRKSHWLLFSVSIAGIFAALFGLMAIIANSRYLILHLSDVDRTTSGTVVSYFLGQNSLIVAEVLSSLLFSGLSGFLLFSKAISKYSPLLAISKFALFAGTIVYCGESGWITLDSLNKTSVFLVMFSALQSVLLFAVWIASWYTRE